MDEKIEKWAENRMNEVFEKEKFAALGKENEKTFQALVFMNRASSEISKAYTILREIEGIENEELKEICGSLQKFIEKIRFVKEAKK